jgi:hypothetical protein
MTKAVEQLIEAVSLLPCRDQTWLLQQLTPRAPLPSFCAQLKQQPSLLQAIILEQGKYVWQANFLRSLGDKGAGVALVQGVVKDLKDATKALVFQTPHPPCGHLLPKVWEKGNSEDSLHG